MDFIDSMRRDVTASVQAWDNLRITASMPDVRGGLGQLGQAFSNPAAATLGSAPGTDPVATAALSMLPRTLEHVFGDEQAVYSMACFLTAFQARSRMLFLEEAVRFRGLAGVTPAALRDR